MTVIEIYTERRDLAFMEQGIGVLLTVLILSSFSFIILYYI